MIEDVMPGQPAVVPVEVCVHCVDEVATRTSVANAAIGGAARVELCADMSVGGLTPDISLVVAAREAAEGRCTLHVMVRPRGGDFAYDAYELREMERSIGQAREAGADGVVFGVVRERVGGLQVASDDRGNLTSSRCPVIDVEATARLVDVARQNHLSVTFHRAFDATLGVSGVDMSAAFASLGQLVDLDVDRVLTSGTIWGAGGTALDGADTLDALARRARGRIEIVVGGSLGRANVSSILSRLGVATGISVHAYSDLIVDGVTSAEHVKQLCAALQR